MTGPVRIDSNVPEIRINGKAEKPVTHEPLQEKVDKGLEDVVEIKAQVSGVKDAEEITDPHEILKKTKLFMNEDSGKAVSAQGNLSRDRISMLLED